MFPFAFNIRKGIAYGGGGNDGGGSQSTQTIQKADPWSGQQPYLTQGFSEAQKLYNNTGPNYFPGSTVAPNSAETNLAQQLTVNRALGGSPLDQSANSQIQNTLGGDYLNNINGIYNNPNMNASNQLTQDTLNGKYLYGGDGFNAAFNAASNRILPQVNSAFERGGRTGSGLAAQAQTQALGDAFAGLYGQERNNQLQSQNLALSQTNSQAQQVSNERANQLRALAFVPQQTSQDYANIGALANVGSQKEGLAQANLNEQINRYNYGQNQPMSKLQDYMNMIQGQYGGTTSTLSQQPLYNNQSAGLLGGAMSGYSMGSSIFPALAGATPWGGIGGAVLGGLFGGGLF